MSGFRYLIVVLIIVQIYSNRALSQCTSVLNPLGYSENFETSNGGWVTGGNSSDWTWGTPAKSVITGAGQGAKCWITGGLNGASYNSNEFAWIQSPCFDFSSISNPQISFLVFWETERRYDGATFQYSTDGGTNWTTLGTDNSNSTCQGTQWYNYSPINFLGSQPGWSGNIQPTSGSCLGGNGSGGWVQARHSLAAVVGLPQVKFRFLFAAGLTCNQFNGFAVDDILIDQATPVGSVDFTGSCINSNTISFNNLNTTCRSSVAWNFGDPNSGASNFGSSDNPTHIFSGSGIYNVTMTVTFNNGQTSDTIKQFTIIDATTTVIKNPTCNGDNDGSVQVVAAGGTGTYFYNWNTNPTQSTPIASNLPAGNYQVNVAALNACAANASVVLTQPDSVSAMVTIQNEICNNGAGQITIVPSGGTGPYTLLWNSGATSTQLTGLSSGFYSLGITDNSGCLYNNSFEVKNIINTLSVSLGIDTFICLGQSLVLNPGSFVSYLWQDGSTTSTYTVTTTGNYSVEVIDINGCQGRAIRNIIVDCSDIYFPTAFTPNGNGLNETFGPAGNVLAMSGYYLKIYNRLGQLVFLSNDPYRKWDGRISGKMSGTQVFVWMSAYSLNGRYAGLKKGNILLIQ